MTDDQVQRAAELLRAGEIVAFPTETVYGLGANALDERAVARIFLAKGRPSHNPLIVHAADAAAARALVLDWPLSAEALAACFWPGPLTLVLPKQPTIPDLVTAGLGTVAVRVPRHPLAHALLEAARLPVAAPSANRSEGVSPTTAAHVRASLGDRVPLILDGGPTEVGIESTVVDLSGEVPRLLRPGMISSDDLAAVLGTRPLVVTELKGDSARTSPGQLERHYAPRAPVVLFREAAPRAADGAGAIVRHAGTSGLRHEILLPDDPAGYARGLYAALHTLDAAGVTQILIQTPPDTVAWHAVRDRLRRASHS